MLIHKIPGRIKDTTDKAIEGEQGQLIATFHDSERCISCGNQPSFAATRSEIITQHYQCTGRKAVNESPETECQYRTICEGGTMMKFSKILIFALMASLVVFMINENYFHSDIDKDASLDEDWRFPREEMYDKMDLYAPQTNEAAKFVLALSDSEKLRYIKKNDQSELFKPLPVKEVNTNHNERYMLPKKFYDLLNYPPLGINVEYAFEELTLLKPHFKDLPEYLTYIKIYICVLELLKSKSEGIAEWFSSRRNLRPSRSDVYIAWTSLGYINRNPFKIHPFIEEKEQWTLLLSGKNPCYRLIGMAFARHFLSEDMLIELYTKNLESKEEIFVILSVLGLSNIDSEKARMIIKNISPERKRYINQFSMQPN